MDDVLKRIGSYSHMVKAHEKSVVLGGGYVLFPVEPGQTENIAVIVRLAIQRAERRSYQRGVRDTQLAMRQAMGLSTR